MANERDVNRESTRHENIENLEGSDRGESDKEDSDFNYSEFGVDEDDDNLYAMNVDAGLEWAERIGRHIGMNSHIEEEAYEENSVEDNSNGFNSASESNDSNDGELRKKKEKKGKHIFPIYMESEDPRWEVGMIFESKKQMKQSIVQHSIKWGKRIKFLKSEANRVKAICEEQCPWFVFASYNANHTLQVKSINTEHTCGRSLTKLPLINSTYLAKRYENLWRLNPEMPISAFAAQIHMDTALDFEKDQLYRARRIALRNINGDAAEQYGLLFNYRAELLHTNPGSTVEINIEPGSNGIFRRMYFCFGCLKKGFRTGCRPIIGLDGCHLKGLYKGQLLTAVSVDANNSMYPVAYAVVEIENQDAWTWFLDLLKSDLHLNGGDGICFISDRQKGLINSIELLLPYAEHRHCVRHLHNNFKSKHKGQQLKEMMWNCATATHVQQYNSAMDKIKIIDSSAHEWLSNQAPHHWSRAHFKTNSKCDILLNNMCEAFNKTILFARDKPILVMLEMMRDFLMRRLEIKRSQMQRHTGKFCPKIEKKLQVLKQKSANCIVKYAGKEIFEAINLHSGSQFAVDLKNQSCGCRRWDLTGLPCTHAIACLTHLKKEADEYVSAYYKKEAYFNAYGGVIHPMNGSSMWKQTGIEGLRPPSYHKQPGRAKRVRKKEPNEIPKVTDDGVTKLSKRIQVSVKCGNCSRVGHNRRGCPILRNREPNQNTEFQHVGRIPTKKRKKKNEGVGEQYECLIEPYYVENEPINGDQYEIDVESTSQPISPSLTSQLFDMYAAIRTENYEDDLLIGEAMNQAAREVEVAHEKNRSDISLNEMLSNTSPIIHVGSDETGDFLGTSNEVLKQVTEAPESPTRKFNEENFNFFGDNPTEEVNETLKIGRVTINSAPFRYKGKCVTTLSGLKAAMDNSKKGD